LVLGAVVGFGFTASAVVTSAAGSAQTVASPIRHVVFIYKENKTFDDVFAEFCQQHPTRCSPPPATVTLADNTTVPLTTHGDVSPELGHTIKMQHYALTNQWDLISGCSAPTYSCLTYESAAGEPNTIALAAKFAISGALFSASPIPSFGGHLETLTAGLDGFTGDNPQSGGAPGWGCDSGRLANWINRSGQLQRVYSCIPDPSLPQAGPYGGAAGPTPVPHRPTILDRCNAKLACTWKFYAQPKDPTSPNGPYIWNSCAYTADCLYSPNTGDVAQAQVITDAQAGALPSISYVMPAVDASGNDDSGHNGESLAVEDTDIGNVVSAIENGPDWSSTAIFITWDDCGCLYDHVPPPPGLGNRLPLIIVSPFARPGYTDRRTATQFSILAYIEHTFGLTSLTNNDARAYDLSGAFNYAQPPVGPIPTVVRGLPAGEHPVVGLTADDGGT
jgi:phospholipase C